MIGDVIEGMVSCMKRDKMYVHGNISAPKSGLLFSAIVVSVVTIANFFTGHNLHFLVVLEYTAQTCAQVSNERMFNIQRKCNWCATIDSRNHSSIVMIKYNTSCTAYRHCMTQYRLEMVTYKSMFWSQTLYEMVQT